MKKQRSSAAATYSLDVLTDGSGKSGHPTLFVSCTWKDIVKARYCFGLGDLLCRAAADQRFKLQCVRALFVPDDQVHSLPALLEVLHSAGRGELSVVSKSCLHKRLEPLIRTVHPHKHHPLVRTCQVPQDHDRRQWWLVYEDQYVKVHVTWSRNQLVYLCSFQQGSQNGSFLILPAPLSKIVSQILKGLPLSGDDRTPIHVSAAVLVSKDETEIDCSSLPSNLPWYSVMPSANASFDGRLLVRAQQQSRFFHKHYPRMFPWNVGNPSIPRPASKRLLTGYSLVVRPSHDLVVQDCLEEIMKEEIGVERLDFVGDLVASLSTSFRTEIDDANEIDLGDETDAEDENSPNTKQCDKDNSRDLAGPAFLVLGTGCASPSPYRGASGYAFLFEDNVSVVLDAGEGFVTQWERYAGGRSLRTIQLIWISHAHLDHYGGLAHLLSCIHLEQETPCHRAEPVTASGNSNKRSRPSPQVPVVVASHKVLRYLQHTFDDGPQYFTGIPHSDAPEVYPNVPSIAFWENVRVDHSCREAYGCIVGVRLPLVRGGNDGTTKVFCFSGDTRPCGRLAHRCQVRGIDFLLHEATYGDAEQEMAVAKKHSTVGEALQMAATVRARRTMLTHFSQRYSTPPAADSNSPPMVACAVDGLLVQDFLQ